MRSVLAIVAFLNAAPLLFIGLANTYIFIRENRIFAGGVRIEEMLMIWPFLATLAGILLGGLVFLAAGIAVLVVKSRVKIEAVT